jgi:hypothetical protein
MTHPDCKVLQLYIFLSVCVCLRVLGVLAFVRAFVFVWALCLSLLALDRHSNFFSPKTLRPRP